MTEFEQLDAVIKRTIRVYAKGVIYASEAAHKIIDDVDYEMHKSGINGHIEFLISVIPILPEPIQTELKKIARSSDETIFIRNVLVSGPYPPPEDWKPPPRAVRSSVNYGNGSPTISLHLDDGTTIQMDGTEPWPQLIFALRKHFDVATGNSG